MAKGNSSLDDRELRAAQAVRAVFGTTAWDIIPRDIAGAAPGTHDFDMYDGQTTVAVEVSTIAKTETLRDSAEWNRHFPDLTFDLENITKGWLVTVSGNGNARETRQQLGAWLAELERVDLFSARTVDWQEYVFLPEKHQPSWVGTLRLMQSAGVLAAEVHPTIPPGQGQLLKIDAGYEWDPSDGEYVSRFVSAQLADVHDSDVQKLNRAIADRRVLFLWLDVQSHFDIIRRLDNHMLGGEVLNAGSVDEVWIGRQFSNGAVTVYRWCAANGWVIFDFPKTDS